MTIETIARHEAAHFVVGWATGRPSLHVDITPSRQRICRNDPTTIIMAVNYPPVGRPLPFDQILTSLAGPVSDHWNEDNARLMDFELHWVQKAVQRIKDGVSLSGDDGDWDMALGQMMYFGVDPTDETRLKAGVAHFLDATRGVLIRCKEMWDDVYKTLLSHQRIGFNGAHPDQGEEAEGIFCKWGDEWGEPPRDVQDYVTKIRNDTDSIFKDSMATVEVF